jgi:hypothetical protein
LSVNWVVNLAVNCLKPLFVTAGLRMKRMSLVGQRGAGLCEAEGMSKLRDSGSQAVSGGFDPVTDVRTGRGPTPNPDACTIIDMPPKKKPPVPAAPLKAQGAGGRKRTPTSAFDAAAGDDVYEPEKVIAQRLAKGITQYQVKWKNYENKDNTWEPIKHLAGCEDMIAEFKEREKTRIAQLEAAATARHAGERRRPGRRAAGPAPRK